MQSENLIAGHNKQEITVIKSQVASKASLTRGQRCRNKLLPCLRPKKHYMYAVQVVLGFCKFHYCDLSEHSRNMCLVYFWAYTVNIYSFLLCPVSTVVSLYGLHLIPYSVQGRSYSKKTVISFTIIPLYLEQQLNVNHTVKLQWKVGHI